MRRTAGVYGPAGEPSILGADSVLDGEILPAGVLLPPASI